MKSQGVAYGDEWELVERWEPRRWRRADVEGQRYGWVCGHCGQADEERRNHGALMRGGRVDTCRSCGESLLDARWSRLP